MARTKNADRERATIISDPTWDLKTANKVSLGRGFGQMLQFPNEVKMLLPVDSGKVLKLESDTGTERVYNFDQKARIVITGNFMHLLHISSANTTFTQEMWVGVGTQMALMSIEWSGNFSTSNSNLSRIKFK